MSTTTPQKRRDHRDARQGVARHVAMSLYGGAGGL